MKRRPFAYLRRSNAGNGKNNNGRVTFDSQRTAVLELAARRGDPEPELIVEWGVSGADKASGFGGTGRGGRRRAYLELKQAIEADTVSAVYAYSLSRLARSTRELLELAELCVAHDVPIRLSKEGDIDGQSPSGRLYLTVLAAVSTFEAEVSAERARDRNESMRDLGLYLGRPPFGWLVDDDVQLVPDPATASTLAKILMLYRDLKSPQRVAKALNDAGIAAPMGGLWRDGTIRRVISRQPGYRPPETVRGSRAVPTATFARLLRCSCGAAMTPTRKRYRTARGEQREWVGYTCSDARYDRCHPKLKSVPESVIRTAAEEEASHLRLPDAVEMSTKAESKRAELDERRARILDGLEHGTFTRPEADERLAKVAAELDALEQETHIEDIPPLDWSQPPEIVNGVLHALFEEIRLGPDLMPQPDGFVWRRREWRAD